MERILKRLCQVVPLQFSWAFKPERIAAQRIVKVT